MNYRNLRSTLIGILFLLCISIALPMSFAALSVDTDKDKYYRGNLVTVTVTGATPNGRVLLQVSDPSGAPIWPDEGFASSTGKITFKFEIGSDWPLGTYTVMVKDQSTGATATCTFKVEKVPPPPPPPPPPGVGKVTISANMTEVEIGGSVTFVVTVLDTDNKPMSGKRVYLYIDDVINASKLTASNGKAVFTVTFNVPGYYDVYAKADNVKSSVVTIYVYRPPSRVTRVELTANATEIDAGGSVMLNATVYDQYDEPMGNVRVDLYINGSYYTTTTTSSDGVATFIVTLNRKGTYEFYVKVNEIKSNSVYVVVRPPPPPKPRVTVVDINVDRVEVLVGGSVKVSILVLDQFNEPMSNVLVKLYVNETLYALNRTNVNGKTFFNVIFDKAGTYVLQAEAEGVRSVEVLVFVSPVPAPPPPIAQYIIYIALILIVVVAVVLVLYYKRREY